MQFSYKKSDIQKVIFFNLIINLSHKTSNILQISWIEISYSKRLKILPLMKE